MATSKNQIERVNRLMNHNIDDRTVQNFFDYYYHDRGMLKWQGFMLSDHVSALRKEQRELIDDNYLCMSPKLIYKQVDLKGKKKQPVEITMINVENQQQIIKGIIINLQPDQVTVLADTTEMIILMAEIISVK